MSYRRRMLCVTVITCSLALAEPAVGLSDTAAPTTALLASVSAASATDIWAVGEQQVGSRVTTLVEHGDGTSWQPVASPSPGADSSTLAAVTALGSKDAWAVGAYTSSSVTHTLVEHWDGTSWTQVTSPDGTAPNSELTAVDALSPTDIWAVGQTDYGRIDYPATLIEHWDGQAWSTVPAAPNLKWAMQTFTGVTAISANNVWAVGYGLVDEEAGYLPLTQHWNGQTWKGVAVPHGDRFNNYYQRGVDATSGSDIWAVGDQELTYRHETTRIEHRTGGPWGTVDAPSPGIGEGTFVYGVSAQSPSDVWAVGTFKNATSFRALVLHWNGSSWQQVTAPSPGGRNDTRLTSVSATSASDSWAVGYFDNGAQKKPVIEHWDGTAWTVVQKGLG